MVQGMGMILESLRQPVINGYLIAGSIVGPGGLQLIKVTELRNIGQVLTALAALNTVFVNRVAPAAQLRPGRPWSDHVCPAYAQELVQVESLAQVGVQLLLFTLGLEFRWVLGLWQQCAT